MERYSFSQHMPDRSYEVVFFSAGGDDGKEHRGDANPVSHGGHKGGRSLSQTAVRTDRQCRSRRESRSRQQEVVSLNTNWYQRDHRWGSRVRVGRHGRLCPFCSERQRASGRQECRTQHKEAADRAAARGAKATTGETGRSGICATRALLV